MYRLSVGAVIRNEAPYIEEWLEFHLLQGVEHFYIYDNMSTDETPQILDRYVKQGLVSVTKTDKFPCQFVSYDEILYRYKKESKWIAFIDCDEFLFSVEHKDLKKVLKLYSQYAAVAVHWVLYGTSGHEAKTEDLVIRRFTKCESGINQHVKSIVQPNRTVSVDKDPHTFIVRGKVCDENRHVLQRHYALMPNGTANLLRINHYHTKSREEAFHRWFELPDPGTNKYRFQDPNDNRPVNGEYTFEQVMQDQDRNDKDDFILYDLASSVEAAIRERRTRC